MRHMTERTSAAAKSTVICCSREGVRASGMTVVDVGAKVSPRRRVLAFDPQRVLYQMLFGNITLNASQRWFRKDSLREQICIPRSRPTSVQNFREITTDQKRRR